MFDNENTWLLVDYAGRSARLTGERRGHVLNHPEMVGQEGRIAETLRQPDVIIASVKDESVHLYHKLYTRAPVPAGNVKVWRFHCNWRLPARLLFPERAGCSPKDV